MFYMITICDINILLTGIVNYYYGLQITSHESMIMKVNTSLTEEGGGIRTKQLATRALEPSFA